MNFARILKFNPHHDAQGRFATGGLADKGFSNEDRILVDYETGRSLSDPKKDKTIRSLLGKDVKMVPYAEAPYFKKLQAAQKTTDLAHLTGDANEASRNALFDAQPLKSVPINKLIYTQNVVNMDAINHLLSGKDSFKGKPAYVVHYKKQYYLIDGHHRTVAEALQKETHTQAHVLEL